MEFQEFSRSMTAQGFDQVIEKVWDPDKTVEAHSHPFHARAVITQGEMWLTVDGHTRHLQPGDTFDLPSGLAHAERYGPAGATYWVARRHPHA